MAEPLGYVHVPVCDGFAEPVRLEPLQEPAVLEVVPNRESGSVPGYGQAKRRALCTPVLERPGGREARGKASPCYAFVRSCCAPFTGRFRGSALECAASGSTPIPLRAFACRSSFRSDRTRCGPPARRGQFEPGILEAGRDRAPAVASGLDRKAARITRAAVSRLSLTQRQIVKGTQLSPAMPVTSGIKSGVGARFAATRSNLQSDPLRESSSAA